MLRLDAALVVPPNGILTEDYQSGENSPHSKGCRPLQWKQAIIRFHLRWDDSCAGKISFAEFDASVKGWVNHVRYADTWGLRTHVLGQGLVFRKPDF